MIAKLRAALAASLLALAATAASAQIVTTLYSEDFQDTGKTTLTAFGWSSFRGGSPSSPTLANSGSTGTGAARRLYININASNSGTSWYAGMSYKYSTAADPHLLPTTDLSQLSLTANVHGNSTASGAPGAAILRIESSDGNWIGWSIPSGSYSNASPASVGGLLSSFTASAGTFDPTSQSITITLAFADTLTSNWTASGNVLAIDNVKLTHISPVPEPASAAALAGVATLGVLALRRRRRAA